MAAASMKREGKVTDMEARAMVTAPSSRGWRKDFENVALEFGELVKEQDSVVAEGNFAGARDGAAAD